MTAVTPLPRTGAVLFDVRDDSRTMRLSRHGDVWVFSTWLRGRCVSSFQLAGSGVAELIAELARGLADGADDWSTTTLATGAGETVRLG